MLILLALTQWATAACDDLDAAAKAERSVVVKTLVDAARAGEPDKAIERVHTLVSEDGLCAPKDRYHAAIVLVKGDDEDLETAFTLASQAHKEGIAPAGTVAAQARDTSLVRQSKAQQYGTMKGKNGNSMCLFRIDEDFSDDDRAELGQPPLDDVLADIVKRANLQVDPTQEALEEAGAICPYAGMRKPTVAAAPAAEEEEGEEEVSDGPVKAVRANSPTGRELTHGELYGWNGFWSGNAWTMEKGRGAIRPLMRSAYGVVDGFDVKSSALGWLFGPNLNVEVAPLQTDEYAVSVEVGGGSAWQELGDSYNVHGELKGSVHVSDTVALTFAGYGSYRQLTIETTINGEKATSYVKTTAIKPKVGAEIHAGESVSIIMHWRMNVWYMINESALATSGGAYFAYGGGPIGLSAGLNINVGQLPASVTDGIPDSVSVPDTAVLPTPHAQIWFRL